jgi:uncharacterized protein YutE (UPF0331/DUF86 family)
MDTTPIVARLSVIADSVSALQDMQEVTLEEFVADDILHTAAEHYFQVAIQAALDIGGMLLAVRAVKVPQGYADIFPSLAEAGVLPKDFADELVGMAKLRNVLVHMYLQVDLGLMYGYLQDKIGDFERFAGYVGEFLTSIAPEQ